MKIIQIEVYIFLIFLTIINLIAVVTSIEHFGENPVKYEGTANVLAVVTIVAAGLQVFSSVIFILIPRKGSRFLFFPQLLLTMTFFFTATGYYMEFDAAGGGPFAPFWQIFTTVEGLNGISGIFMLLVLGREGWGDILSEDRPSKMDNYHQQQTLPRFQPPPQQTQAPYGYGGNKQY